MGAVISNKTILYLLLISFLVSVVIVCTVFLIKKALLRKSLRTFLAAAVFISQIFGAAFVVFSTLYPIGGNGPLQQILDTTGILSILPVRILLTCYILEVKIPCSLTPKKMLVLVSPLLVVTLYVLSFYGHITCLSTVTDLTENIGKPDVIARLLMNILYIAYPALVIAVRPNNKQDGIRPFIILLPLLFFIITALGIVGFGLLIFPCLYANSLALCVFDYLIIRLELFNEKATSDVDEPKADDNTKLQIDDEVWMDPEMSADKLAKILGMNQHYLSEAIKKAGYLNYFDMMNSKRVEYICKMISENPEESARHLSAWMYDAGFRSRNTAINAFKKIKGCTPSEYLKSFLK